MVIINVLLMIVQLFLEYIIFILILVITGLELLMELLSKAAFFIADKRNKQPQK
jgi:hypothetical protein